MCIRIMIDQCPEDLHVLHISDLVIRLSCAMGHEHEHSSVFVDFSWPNGRSESLYLLFNVYIDIICCDLFMIMRLTNFDVCEDNS